MKVFTLIAVTLACSPLFAEEVKTETKKATTATTFCAQDKMTQLFLNTSIGWHWQMRQPERFHQAMAQLLFRAMLQGEAETRIQLPPS